MRIVSAFLAGMLLLGPGITPSADSFLAAKSAALDVHVVFTNEEIRIIRAHYDANDGNKGNGKHKRKGLPPGIEKNLARGKPLPPGIARQALPWDLRDALPPARDGYERVIVGGKVLLVEIATQVIHDVLVDVVLD